MPTTKEQKSEGLISVTEVLDYFQEPGLVAWKIKTGAKEVKRTSTVAIKIGCRVEDLIEEDWKTGKFKLSSKDPLEVRNCMTAWQQFKLDYLPEIVSMQTELTQGKLIGHRDMLAIIGRNRVTIDLKTSSRINPKHWLQVAKYLDMDDENTAYSDGYANNIGILRLDKNLGIYEYEMSESAPKYIEVFNCLYEVFWFFKTNAPMELTERDANGDCSSTTNSSTDRGF